MRIDLTSRPIARLALSGLVAGGLAAAALGLGAGMGNVNEGIWDGDNPPPPPEALVPRQCPPIAFMCP